MKARINHLLKNDYVIIGGILSLLLVTFLIILYKTEGYIGEADSLTHYKYSRYSWLYPKFLLYHWGKPVFTLLTSPFALLGHDGVAVFNLLAGLLSCFFAWLSARKLQYRTHFLVPFLIMFMPIYSLNVISGLTEVLFGLFLIATTFLMLDKRYIWAAILVSFVHLVRTEGIVLIPVYGLYLLVIKQYRMIPWLFTGTVVYSIIGYFYYDNLFWLITEMPYTGGAVSLYGTGRFFHFFDLSPRFFGPFSVVLLSLGILTIFIGVFKKKLHSMDEMLLVFLPFFIYFMAHVVMWWSGIGSSLGMTRYMVAIVPLGGLLALKGFNLLRTGIDNSSGTLIWGKVFAMIVLALFLTQPFNVLRNFPRKLTGMDKVMHQASQYILANNLNENRIIYYDPAFFYFIGFSPYNPEEAKEGVYNIESPHEKINTGEIIIWDGHFAAIKRLSLDSLRVNPYFDELAVFDPESPFTIFGTDYRVVVFQRNEK